MCASVGHIVGPPYSIMQGTSRDTTTTLQNTATVLEYRCLYTPDLKKKQKKWHDGRLKFHTFNRKIVVHDERGNFIGDSHWRDTGEFGEGKELELERGSFLIEVADCVGKKEQDLSELFEKRLQDREDRALARAAATGSSPISGLRTQQVRSVPSITTTVRSRDLVAVLGSPTGHYGRAIVANVSPYEQRQRLFTKDDVVPARKRQKMVSPPRKSGYAQSLTGATLSLSSTPSTFMSSSTRFRSDVCTRLSSLPRNVERLDLTGDLSGPSDVVDSVTAPSVHKRTGRKKRLRTTSPPSGYAVTLTGAALDLTGGMQRDSGEERCASTVSMLTSLNSYEDFIDIDSTDPGTRPLASTSPQQAAGSVEDHSSQLTSPSLHLEPEAGPPRRPCPEGEALKDRMVSSSLNSNLRDPQTSLHCKPVTRRTKPATGVAVPRNDLGSCSVISDDPIVLTEIQHSKKGKQCQRKDGEANADSKKSLRIKSKSRKPMLSLSKPVPELSSPRNRLSAKSIASPACIISSVSDPPSDSSLVSRTIDHQEAFEKAREKLHVRIRDDSTTCTDDEVLISPENVSLFPFSSRAVEELSIESPQQRNQISAVLAVSPQISPISSTVSTPVVDRSSRVSTMFVRGIEKYEPAQSQHTRTSGAGIVHSGVWVCPETDLSESTRHPLGTSFSLLDAVPTHHAPDRKSWHTPTQTVEETIEPIQIILPTTKETGGKDLSLPTVPPTLPGDEATNLAIERLYKSEAVQVTSNKALTPVANSVPTALLRPLLNNPATRGKKAAQKRDQSLLLRSFVTPEVEMAQAPPFMPNLRSQGPVNEDLEHIRPGMPMWGPISAPVSLTGPWTREAFDLFGWKPETAN